MLQIPSYRLPVYLPTLLLAGGSLLLGPNAAAQQKSIAPVTQAVDSIYRLTVDSAAYREYPYVVLLDEGVTHHEADGRGERTYRQVVQILKDRGVQPWAERRFSYQPGHDTIIVNWMRVVTPSGAVVSAGPGQVQLSDVPASTVSPIYTDTKILRYSVGGVAPGTLVDVSWTLRQTHPYVPGDFYEGWNVTMPIPALRSRFVLDVPTAMTPRIVERHLNFSRGVIEASGRRVYSWTAKDVKPVKAELFAPDTSIPTMAIRASAPITWNDVGRWYDGLSRDRYVLSASLTSRVDSVVRGSATTDDTLRALHHWIAAGLRYVSISLGTGGYQPRFPDSTVASGFGDCKDKATLFIAAARHLKMAAFPVLLSSVGVRDRDLPAIEQFDHVVAAVRLPASASYEFLDLTAAAFPPGHIPPSYQGQFGLVVLAGGQTEEVTFPEDEPGLIEEHLTGELQPDGRARLRVVSTVRGRSQYGLRATLSEPIDSWRRSAIERTFSRLFAGAKMDSVITSDGKDWRVPPRLEVTLHDGQLARPTGPVMILSLPADFRGDAPRYRRYLEELKKRDTERGGPRTQPIDAALVAGRAGTASSHEVRVMLPEGWKAELPKNVSASSAFGSYSAEYSQTGRELRVVHRLGGASGVYPAGRIDELEKWLEAVSRDEFEYIALTPGK